MPEKQYIAVFDSGVGGVSVLRELIKEMPNEDYLYFGDSANAPYGTRSTQEVRCLTMAAAEKLLSRNVKALVVACNTATAAAIDDLRRAYPDKIIVGIEPALKVAADNYPRGAVGVMATPVTLREEKFHQLSGRFPEMEVSLIPAPGLVELIEQGCSDRELEAFLRPLLEDYAGRLDAVVLGCTHYPFAAEVIEKILHTAILDGGRGTAIQTRRRLEEAGLLGGGTGTVQIENSADDPKMIARTRELLNQHPQQKK
ncbi:MAG: glutamate racemase [Oscillospiraceae bacterium]|nr:glutamate racemase [Oscillospiraceae bacterium]MBQ8797009.1 glutamate racemase [Oscillospiraceae bacterium]